MRPTTVSWKYGKLWIDGPVPLAAAVRAEQKRLEMIACLKGAAMRTERAENHQMVVGRTRLSRTQTGREVAELFSADTRLKFPELTLFDLSMLEMIDISPDELRAAGSDGIIRRYTAEFTESEKTNSRGRPYRDVVALHPINGTGSPVPAAQTIAADELIAEIRELRAAIEHIEDMLDMLLDRHTAQEQTGIAVAYADDPNADHVVEPNANQVEELVEPEQPHAELDARARFYQLAAAALRDHQVGSDVINAKVKLARETGWPAMAQELAELIDFRR